jgi:hypothetical protein
MRVLQVARKARQTALLLYFQRRKCAGFKYNRAAKGCQYEAENKNTDAWWEWHNIFGDDVPLN